VQIQNVEFTTCSDLEATPQFQMQQYHIDMCSTIHATFVFFSFTLAASLMMNIEHELIQSPPEKFCSPAVNRAERERQPTWNSGGLIVGASCSAKRMTFPHRSRNEPSETQCRCSPPLPPHKYLSRIAGDHWQGGPIDKWFRGSLLHHPSGDM
jgi:hypothetical protein